MKNAILALLLPLSFYVFGDDNNRKEFKVGDKVYYDCVSDNNDRKVIGGIVQVVGGNGAVKVDWSEPSDCTSWVGDLNLWSSREYIEEYSKVLSQRPVVEMQEKWQRRLEAGGLQATMDADMEEMAKDTLSLQLLAFVPALESTVKQLESVTDAQIKSLSASDKETVITGIEETRSSIEGEPLLKSFYDKLLHLEERFKK